MRIEMKLKLIIVGVAVLLLNSFSVSAQSEEDALTAFNDGATKSQSEDYKGAIESFINCIEIFDEMEEFENEQRMQAEQLIPQLQYKHAANVYRSGDLDKAIEEFQLLEEYSVEYGSSKYEKRAKGTIPKLYYAKGKKQLDAKEFDAALENLNKSVELDPNYGTAFLRIAMLHEKQENQEGFCTAIEGALTAAANKNDEKTRKNAEALAKKFFSTRGATALKAKDYTTAEKYYTGLLKYMTDNPDVYYQLADIHINLTNYDQAIETANKGVALYTEETTQDAKLYFVIGKAYAAKGENGAACDAYKKANKGDYAEQADYQIKHVLKCE